MTFEKRRLVEAAVQEITLAKYIPVENIRVLSDFPRPCAGNERTDDEKAEAFAGRLRPPRTPRCRKMTALSRSCVADRLRRSTLWSSVNLPDSCERTELFPSSGKCQRFKSVQPQRIHSGSVLGKAFYKLVDEKGNDWNNKQ